jgi:hypothetical protein
LGLLARPNVVAAFAGHAHNFWYDRFEETDYYLAPSTCFVRQDYSEMQRVAAPEDSEFGRNDSAKLGYFVVKVFAQGHAVQFARTFGAELAAGQSAASVRELAPTPKENPSPLIGFDLRQNWAEISEVPPSGGLDEFDRKLARNDYPLLALIEMGIRDIRIPLADLRDPYRRARLRTLCHLGMRSTLFCFGIPTKADLLLIEGCRDCLTDWEITIDWPELDQLRPALAKAHARTGLPIYISRMRSKADLPAGSLYFHVINHGFDVGDTAQIAYLAECSDDGIVGAVFRLGTSQPIAETLLDIEGLAASRSLQASVHLRVASDNPAVAHVNPEETQSHMSEVLKTTPQLTRTRVFCDTLSDNDRGYFPRQGAIDRNGNPNPLLDIIRLAHLE